MSGSGQPFLLSPFEGPPSASPSVAETTSQARFLLSQLNLTNELIPLSGDQIPNLTHGSYENLSEGDTIMLPLLCSTIHALASVCTRLDPISASMSELQKQSTTISSYDSDFREIRSSLRDLSHRMTPSFLPRPIPVGSLYNSSTVMAPAPPPSARPPSSVPASRARPSYAAVIHGGTSEFDHAVQDNAARAKSKGKGKGKKPSGSTAAKVASVVEASSPKRPPPLTSAVRRFYAPLMTPAPHPQESLIRVRLPGIVATVLRESNFPLPCAFKAFINSKGAVSLVGVDTSVPAESYAPFFTAFTSKLN